jgi:hypothetical protein
MKIIHQLEITEHCLIRVTKRNFEFFTIYSKLIPVNCKLISSEHKHKFQVNLKTISSNMKFSSGLLEINVYLLEFNFQWTKK